MSSNQFGGKSVRSHSIHVAIGRDYDRIKMAQKQDVKLEKDLLSLERKLISHAKWNQRADSKNLLQNPTNNNSNPQERPAITLKEFMEREKIKQDNILNSKKVANQNIRRN